MRTTAMLLLFTLPLAAALRAQTTKIELKPKWMPDEIVRPPEVEKARAKEMIDVFKETIDEDDVDVQLAAIDKLLEGRHERMVKPLAKLLTRAEHPVRRRAAKALAALGESKAIPYLERAMKSQKNRTEGDIMDALGTAIGVCCQEGKSLYRKYHRELERGSKEHKRAVILIFGHSKDEKALPLLAEWLTAPRPENPDSPSNPPASYWKARYFEWNYVRHQVSWAVWSITGELLETKDEVEAWIEEQKKKRRR